MFRQGVPGTGVSIEEGTENVPLDGRYYVLVAGRVDRSYGTLRGAVRRYATLRAPTATPGGPVGE